MDIERIEMKCWCLAYGETRPWSHRVVCSLSLYDWLSAYANTYYGGDANFNLLVMLAIWVLHLLASAENHRAADAPLPLPVIFSFSLFTFLTR